MIDTKTRIEQLKIQIRSAETAKTVAETQLAAARQQEQEAIKALADAGVTPETVKDEIQKLESAMPEQINQIETGIAKLKKLGLIP